MLIIKGTGAWHDERRGSGGRNAMSGVAMAHEAQVGRFCHALRMQLWQEHLGLSHHDMSVADPVCFYPCFITKLPPLEIAPAVYDAMWLATARQNTEAFEHVFPNIPSNSNAVCI
jgi:hypothetical protein